MAFVNTIDGFNLLHRLGVVCRGIGHINGNAGQRHFFSGTAAANCGMHLPKTAAPVLILDLTVQDNRHIRLQNLKRGEWSTLYLDFSRDSRRNDGTVDAKFSAG